LLRGYYFIRHKKIFQRRACMITAFICSTVFLTSYIYFHLHAGIIGFGGQGAIRPLFFTLLSTHTSLAIVNLTLVLITLSFALRETFTKFASLGRAQ